MGEEQARPPIRYTPPADSGGAPAFLVARDGSGTEQRFEFYDRIEIGRNLGYPAEPSGCLLLSDESVSRRHCVVRRAGDGKLFIRDLSRNGTRVDGRRLVPNVETEIRAGQTITVSQNFSCVLAADPPRSTPGPPRGVERTVSVAGETMATVLVGDIRDYTGLVRSGSTLELQQSVARVFEALNRAVTDHGGTVKEYQGDALFAFWEEAWDSRQVVAACRAALELDALARRLAVDKKVWTVPDVALRIDWALATGWVVIDSFGDQAPTGLSMIGEAVVRAFRIEKFASDQTGSIIACAWTRKLACKELEFRDQGRHQAKGFDHPEQIYSLCGPRT